MSENVYSRLAELAAGFLEPDALERWSVKPTIERDERFLRINTASLSEARSLLDRPCRVDVEYEYAFMSRHIGTTSQLDRLGTAFCLQFHKRQRAGDFTECARIGLDLFRVAQNTRRGGLVIDAITSAGMEGKAVNLLRQIRGKLPPEAAIALAADILESEAAREPFETIQARDDDWEKRVEYPAPTELPPREPMQWSDEDIAEHGLEKLREFDAEFGKFVDALVNRSPAESRADSLRLDLSRLALRRMLAVELAAKAYGMRCGRNPVAIDEFIPEYLSAEPIDPFSNASFQVRLQPTFAVYSVGPHGADFGGVLGSYLAAMMYKCNFGVDCDDYESGEHDPPRRLGILARWARFLRRVIPRRTQLQRPTHSSSA